MSMHPARMQLARPQGWPTRQPRANCSNKEAVWTGLPGESSHDFRWVVANFFVPKLFVCAPWLPATSVNAKLTGPCSACWSCPSYSQISQSNFHEHQHFHPTAASRPFLPFNTLFIHVRRLFIIAHPSTLFFRPLHHPFSSSRPFAPIRCLFPTRCSRSAIASRHHNKLAPRRHLDSCAHFTIAFLSIRLLIDLLLVQCSGFCVGLSGRTKGVESLRRHYSGRDFAQLPE